MAATLLFCVMASYAVTGALTEAVCDARVYVTTTGYLACPTSLSNLNSSQVPCVKFARIDDRHISIRSQHFTALRRLSYQNYEISHLSQDDFESLKDPHILLLTCNNIISLPVGLFWYLHSVVMLSLAGNYIRQLSSYTFSSLNHLSLLDLGKNQLSNIQRESFEGLGNLLYLYLDYNSLEDLESDVFDYLLSVENITLDHNSISWLSEGTFARLAALKCLRLEHNQLTRIDDKMFYGFKNTTSLSIGTRFRAFLRFVHLDTLEELYLDGNMIQHFYVLFYLRQLKILEVQNNNMKDIAGLAYLDDISVLNISGNPLSCTYFLEQIWRKWKEQNVQVDASCIIPRRGRITQEDQIVYFRHNGQSKPDTDDQWTMASTGHRVGSIGGTSYASFVMLGLLMLMFWFC